MKNPNVNANNEEKEEAFKGLETDATKSTQKALFLNFKIEN